MGNADPGFRVLPELFAPSDLAPVIASLDTMSISRRRGGVRRLLTIPEVARLAKDQRLVELASQFVGKTPYPFRATLFDKSAQANWLVAWHQDTVLPVARRVDSSEWGPWTTKAGVLHARAPAAALEQVVAIRIHLDDSASANGPLRVLPDTHTRGVLSHEEITDLAGQLAAVDCLAPVGGAVVMRPLVVHASSKSLNALRRRVLHIEYAASVDLGTGIEPAFA